MLRLVPALPTSELDLGVRPCPQCGSPNMVEEIPGERSWCAEPQCNLVFSGGQEEWAQWLAKRQAHQAWMRSSGRAELSLVVGIP